MSALSAKLEYLIQKKGKKIATIAAQTGIDRATVHQYIKGTRALQNREHLNAMMATLQLTPDEHAEVLQQWEITRVGERTYNRRRCFEALLSSLQYLEDETPLPVQRENAAENLPQSINVAPIVHGELEINRLLGMVIQDAAAREKDMLLLTQPDYDAVMQALLLIYPYTKTAKITHLICLEADSGADGCANLEYIQKTLRCTVGLPHYEPYYFYGKATEHYGEMNLLPYLVLSDRYALQISTDRKTALVHTDNEIIIYLTRRMEEMRKSSNPLMLQLDGLSDERALWGTNYIQKAAQQEIYSIYTGLITNPFWDERLLRSYLNHNLPNWEMLVQVYIAQSQALHASLQKNHIIEIMCRNNVEDFIRTGEMREFPSLYFEKPLSKADRRLLVEQVIQAVEAGWLHIRLVKAENFALGYGWEVCAHRNDHLLLHNPNKTSFRVYYFNEPDIIDCAYDYMKALCEKPGTLDDKDSIAQLRQWMDKYLTE